MSTAVDDKKCGAFDKKREILKKYQKTAGFVENQNPVNRGYCTIFFFTRDYDRKIKNVVETVYIFLKSVYNEIIKKGRDCYAALGKIDAGWAYI